MQKQSPNAKMYKILIQNIAVFPKLKICGVDKIYIQNQRRRLRRIAYI